VFHQTGAVTDLNKREYIFTFNLPSNFNKSCKNDVEIFIKGAMLEHVFWKWFESLERKELTDSHKG
jgi:hypothetical protein